MLTHIRLADFALEVAAASPRVAQLARYLAALRKVLVAEGCAVDGVVQLHAAFCEGACRGKHFVRAELQVQRDVGLALHTHKHNKDIANTPQSAETTPHPTQYLRLLCDTR